METKDCLESWFTQAYPEFEILFGVSAPDDPVCQIVRALQAKHPGVAAQLVICDLAAGPNRKVAKLAVLEPLARHQIIVVSDADVKAPRDFLDQSVPAFKDENTGLVNSFYFLSTACNLPMRWEALAVNADFWSGVLQAKSLKPLDFALGAVMLIRRNYLDRIGGFRRLADFLADDYQLGSQIAREGGRIELSPVPVECREAPHGFRHVWRHQLRWNRTVRVCQPAAYFLSILRNAIFWSLLAFAANPRPITGLALTLVVGLRILMAGHLQTLLTRKTDHWPYVWLAPINDLLHVILWAASFGGSNVHWRGQNFRVSRDGRLVHRPAQVPVLQEVSAS